MGKEGNRSPRRHGGKEREIRKSKNVGHSCRSGERYCITVVKDNDGMGMATGRFSRKLQKMVLPVRVDTG